MKSPQETRLEAVSRIRDRLRRVLQVRFSKHGEEASEIFNVLIKRVEAVCDAYYHQNPGAIYGAFQGFEAALFEALEFPLGIISGLETEKQMTETARDIAVAERDAAHYDLGRARDQHGRELAARDERIRTFEKLFRDGESSVIRSLGKCASDLTTELDDLLETARALLGNINGIRIDAEEGVPELEKSVIKVEERMEALALSAAPLRARAHALSADEFSALDKAVREYGELKREFEWLKAELDKMKEALKSGSIKFGLWRELWMNMRGFLDAAVLIFPKLNLDFWSAAGTEETEVRRKREECGRLEVEIKQAASRADYWIKDRQGRISEKLARISSRFEELDELRSFMDTPEFDAKSDEDKGIIRALVLSFSDDSETLSAPKLAMILGLAEIIENKGAETARRAEALMIETFFNKRGDPRFRSFGLCGCGEYWRRRWLKERPELALKLSSARKLLPQLAEEQANKLALARKLREEEAEAKRAKAEALKEAARQAREEKEKQNQSPQAILGRLRTQIARDILTAASLRRELPHPHDGYGWAILISAGAAAGLIETAAPGKVKAPLRSILSLRPALFALKAMPNGRRLVWTEAGRNVYRSLPPPSRAAMDEFEKLMGKNWKFWGGRTSNFVRRLRTALDPVLHKIPADDLTLLE